MKCQATSFVCDYRDYKEKGKEDFRIQNIIYDVKYEIILFYQFDSFIGL